MAACGLESYRRDSTHIFEYEDYDHQPEENVVKIMAEFAAQMIAVLDKMTTESFPTCKPYKYVTMSHQLSIIISIIQINV